MAHSTRLNLNTPRLKNAATAEGTQRFKTRALRENTELSTAHFKSFDTPEERLTLSSLGMGSYLGDTSAHDDQLMHDALVTSVLSGAINVIDTAINYRLQRSERSIGKALKTLAQQHGVLRDELFIASKNGFLTPDADVDEDFRTYFQREFIASGIVNPLDIASGMHCMSPTYLEDQLNRSLLNLEIETLDLMYLHNAAESQLSEVGLEVFLSRLEKAFAFYEQARKDQKIRYYGLASWQCFRVSPDEEGYLSLKRVLALAEKVGGKHHGFRFVQLPVNLAYKEAFTLKSQPVFEGFSTFLEAAQAYGMGVFTSVPLLQGQLLSHPTPHHDGLKTPAQNCLQIVRSLPGVIAPLVGHKQAKHVEDNIQVATVDPLDAETLAEYL